VWEIAPKETLTPCQLRLRAELIDVLTHALSVGRESEVALQAAQRSYHEVAKVLVELRHEFTTSDGRTPDLKGRSAGYRRIVRSAYERVGAAGSGPIEKRLTAGTAYWVRRILLDRYGETGLHAMGALPRQRVIRRSLERLSSDPHESFARAAGILNLLATDLAFSPDDQILRSVARAVVLLQRRQDGVLRELGAA